MSFIERSCTLHRGPFRIAFSTPLIIFSECMILRQIHTHDFHSVPRFCSLTVKVSCAITEAHLPTANQKIGVESWNSGLCIVYFRAVLKIYYRLVSLPGAIGQRSDSWVSAANNMKNIWLGIPFGIQYDMRACQHRRHSQISHQNATNNRNQQPPERDDRLPDGIVPDL